MVAHVSHDAPVNPGAQVQLLVVGEQVPADEQGGEQLDDWISSKVSGDWAPEGSWATSGTEFQRITRLLDDDTATQTFADSAIDLADSCAVAFEVELERPVNADEPLYNADWNTDIPGSNAMFKGRAWDTVEFSKPGEGAKLDEDEVSTWWSNSGFVVALYDPGNSSTLDGRPGDDTDTPRVVLE